MRTRNASIAWVAEADTADARIRQSSGYIGLRSSSARPLPSIAKGTELCRCAIRQPSIVRRRQAVVRYQRSTSLPAVLRPVMWLRLDTHPTSSLASTERSLDAISMGPSQVSNPCLVAGVIVRGCGVLHQGWRQVEACHVLGEAGHEGLGVLISDRLGMSDQNGFDFGAGILHGALP
jgi:hypothetical protein